MLSILLFVLMVLILDKDGILMSVEEGEFGSDGPSGVAESAGSGDAAGSAGGDAGSSDTHGAVTGGGDDGDESGAAAGHGHVDGAGDVADTSFAASPAISDAHTTVPAAAVFSGGFHVHCNFLSVEDWQARGYDADLSCVLAEHCVCGEDVMPGAPQHMHEVALAVAELGRPFGRASLRVLASVVSALRAQAMVASHVTPVLATRSLRKRARLSSGLGISDGASGAAAAVTGCAVVSVTAAATPVSKALGCCRS